VHKKKKRYKQSDRIFLLRKTTRFHRGRRKKKKNKPPDNNRSKDMHEKIQDMIAENINPMPMVIQSKSTQNNDSAIKPLIAEQGQEAFKILDIGAFLYIPDIIKMEGGLKGIRINKQS
jgi:hypothetical protein